MPLLAHLVPRIAGAGVESVVTKALAYLLRSAPRRPPSCPSSLWQTWVPFPRPRSRENNISRTTPDPTWPQRVGDCPLLAARKQVEKGLE